ncbi:MAG: SiaB family protein kinase [Bacteroidales bacterium]|nr:SiaB family protein kinase [Bacteroidales bacterium]
MLKTGEGVFLYHKGPILYDTIGYLISELKEKMFEAQVKQAVYKKVLMVMIEALENIFKYHEHFGHNKAIMKSHPPYISIIRQPQCFIVESANPVRKADAVALKARLGFIAGLDKAGIKEMYKQTITNGQFSEKGGAGLGIIEIAKISDDALNFEFLPIDTDFEFYKLKLIIKQT